MDHIKQNNINMRARGMQNGNDFRKHRLKVCGDRRVNAKRRHNVETESLRHERIVACRWVKTIKGAQIRIS